MLTKRGFTLIELIMVIVILGILSVIAIPKYVDLQSEAIAATADGVFSSVVAACAINYAEVKTKGSSDATLITTCATLKDALELSSGLTIEAETGGDDCKFTIDSKEFFFGLTEATDDAPCKAEKTADKWPTS
ncbi:MAG: type II secretion system protein [Nitrospinota bacterium]